ILPKGLDHILFILGLFLLSIKFRPLLLQVTMFTVAHSITLSLAMLGVFSLPANIVEPLIALSIAYVGVENIVTKTIKPSRLITVFVFGLLHGMGFASMLSDFGMPKDAFAAALIAFNVGVELGQLTIIVIAFVSVAYWFRQKAWYRKAVVIPASFMISVIGLIWTYQRIAF
ncbi:MAG TPA: HupE/UreJ family protein, partial [Ghiorsea sp.]|nr:HupE/UreJ family protein [Ghiorsea sp.]